MKKTILLAITTIFLAYGVSTSAPNKNNKDDKPLTKEEQLRIDNQVGMYVEHPMDPPFGLKGKEKWNADSYTKESIAKMKKVIADFNKSKNKDYRKLGIELNNIGRSIVDDNKATEPDKDAIMMYMASIIGNSGMIKLVSKKDLAAKVLKLLSNKLDDFDTYFK